MPKLEIHLLTHDAEGLLEWSLRHYLDVADLIVVHDGGPTFESRRKAERLFPAAMGTRLHFEDWQTAGELNDDLARKLKNECWLASSADFVGVLDMDELLWAPGGLRARVERAIAQGAAVLRPNGFEMFSDVWYDAAEYGPEERLTELVPNGAPDDHWYGKPVLFSPKLVAASGFGIGAHESRPALHDGRMLKVDRAWPFAGDLALLHYKSIYGGPAHIAARYDETRKRLSAQNVRAGWGNFAPGDRHAAEKRALLVPHVRPVTTETSIP